MIKIERHYLKEAYWIGYDTEDTSSVKNLLLSKKLFSSLHFFKTANKNYILHSPVYPAVCYTDNKIKYWYWDGQYIK